MYASTAVRPRISPQINRYSSKLLAELLPSPSDSCARRALISLRIASNAFIYSSLSVGVVDDSVAVDAVYLDQQSL